MTLMLFNSCEKKENDKTIDYSGDNCIDNNESFQPVAIPDNDDYQLTFYRDSKIQIYADDNGINGVGTESGSNLVFQYEYTFDDDPVIVDDEYSEEIKFEIESG
jgi:hypothetical protein